MLHLPQGTLNRGAVCVRLRQNIEISDVCMHISLSTDVKEPGWPSESLGAKKQTDGTSIHKRPENGKWLPTGGQLVTVMYVYPPRHKEKEKKEKKNCQFQDQNQQPQVLTIPSLSLSLHSVIFSKVDQLCWFLIKQTAEDNFLLSQNDQNPKASTDKLKLVLQSFSLNKSWEKS